MARLSETPSQTAGPYLHLGLVRPPAAPPPPAVAGEVALAGHVLDGAGAALRDALIEVRDPFAPSGTRNWHRAVCDGQSGEWRLRVAMPQPGPAPDGTLLAACLSLWIVARGINRGLTTRMNFPGAPDTDLVLRSVPQARRETLFACETPEGFRFDIHLQGPRETVFFDI